MQFFYSVLALNAGLWWREMESGSSWTGYGALTSDGRTATAGGYTWTHYYRVVSVPSSVVRPKAASPYFQLEQAAGATTCQWLVADLVITDNTVESMKYLTEAMEQAKSGTTDITGGLVLSQFIGVRGGTDGKTVVAGLCGKSTQDWPMIFAGRDGSNPNGKFQVDNSGETPQLQRPKHDNPGQRKAGVPRWRRHQERHHLRDADRHQRHAQQGARRRRQWDAE